MTPEVSIILPSYNRLSYLRQAVESVFAQTLTDWELIIADDGSDEETYSYLAGVARDARVQVLRLTHRGVPGAVRNAALPHARGSYVAFLDSDDLWRPRKLEQQVAALRAGGTRRWCYTGYEFIDAAGKVCGQPYWVPRAGPILPALLDHAAVIWTPAVMVDRQLLVRLGGFDETLTVFEDCDLWLRLALRSQIALVDEPLICVRRHEQHYRPEGVVAPMASCRHRSLQRLRSQPATRAERRLIGRAYARSVLDLAGIEAQQRRASAVYALLSGGQGSWRYGAWWLGLPRILAQLLLPQSVMRWRRAASVGRDTARGPR